MAAARPLLSPTVRNYVANTAAVISILPICVGINGLARPHSALSMLGLTTPSTAKDQALAEGLTQMYACRQMTMGLTTAMLWRLGHYRAMGWSLVLGCVVAGVDGMATKRLMGEGEWNHWGALPVSLALGVSLLL